MGQGSGGTRRYTAEFKRDAVALLVSSGRPTKEVARELGVSDASLGAWLRAEQGGSQGRKSTEAEKDKEEVRLRRRIRELEQEIEILKRFTSYWVKEQSR